MTTPSVLPPMHDLTPPRLLSALDLPQNVRADSLSVVSVAGDLVVSDVWVGEQLEIRIGTGLVKAADSTSENAPLTLASESQSLIALG